MSSQQRYVSIGLRPTICCKWFLGTGAFFVTMERVRDRRDL
jgi:hypothetical protein